MVPPLGIEPSSTMLQTVAMTTSAKAALIGGGIVESNSNRFRSPSVFKTVLGPAQITLQNLVPPTRIELVIAGYQPTVIPFNYRGIFGDSWENRTPVIG